MMSSAADWPVSAEGTGTPETALQLALDLTSLDRAADLVAKLSPALGRIEVGTPLAIASGLTAIDRIRPLSRPGAVIVADVKICDAGEKIARSAYAAGADVVTVVAPAIDEITWRGVLTAAADQGRGGRDPAPILVDTVGARADPAALGRLASAAAEAGVAVDLCLHRPKTAPPSFADLIRPLYGHRLAFDHLAVAGKLLPAQVRPALEAGFGTLIVGGAVTDADDPIAVWDTFRAEIRASLVPAEPDVRKHNVRSRRQRRRRGGADRAGRTRPQGHLALTGLWPESREPALPVPADRWPHRQEPWRRALLIARIRPRDTGRKGMACVPSPRYSAGRPDRPALPR
jgi:3-hexulose-6-phosphate synthase